ANAEAPPFDGQLILGSVRLDDDATDLGGGARQAEEKAGEQTEATLGAHAGTLLRLSLVAAPCFNFSYHSMHFGRAELVAASPAFSFSRNNLHARGRAR